MQTFNLTQNLAMVGAIVPGTSQAAAGSYVTEAIPVAYFSRLAALIEIGTLAGSATVLVKFQLNSGSVSSDAAWADVNSGCVTSAFASGSNSKLAALEYRIDQNPPANSLLYARALASVATSTWNGGCIVVGTPPVYRPAKDIDSSNVVAITVY